MIVLRVLRSLLFMVIFYGGTLFAVVVALAAAVIGRGPLRAAALAWVRFHGWCTRWLLGIRNHIEGEIPKGPVLIAAKHQAHYEAIELVRILNGPDPVMKQQLADIPLWGWLARRYGAISVDRDQGANALRKMLREAEESKAAGHSILIFPEGTRVPPGSTPPLQPGFAGLYRRLGLPVVPVALDSGRVWPRRGLWKHAGVVTIRFGEPIPTGLPRQEIDAQVHAAINALETAP